MFCNSDSLEIFNQGNIIIETIKINKISEFKNFLLKYKISYVIYNKKKFFHLMICDSKQNHELQNIIENLSNDSILFFSGINSIEIQNHQSFFLKKNQTLISNSLFKKTHHFQICVQNYFGELKIINLIVEKIFSKIKISFNENQNHALNSTFKLNDECEINGIQFEIVLKKKKFQRSFIEAEYKKNIILKNLIFSSNNNFTDLCFIEFYKVYNFEFINNKSNNSNSILFKNILCQDINLSLIKSEVENNSKIEFIDPDNFIFQNIKLFFLENQIDHIFFLTKQTNLDDLNFSQKNILFIIDVEKQYNSQYFFLRNCVNCNFFFYSISKSESLFFSYHEYTNFSLKFHKNSSLKNDIKYISFFKDFELKIIENNFFHFINIFLKINQENEFHKFLISEKIKTLLDSKILFKNNFDAQNLIDFSENLFHWHSNFFLLKKSNVSKIQNVFKIDHKFRFDEIKTNFFSKNKFILNINDFNLIDTQFLMSKIFLLKKFFFKKNFHEIKTLIIKKNNLFEIQEKIFSTSNNQKKFLILSAGPTKKIIEFFFINSEKFFIQKFESKKIEKDFYFLNLKYNLFNFIDL